MQQTQRSDPITFVDTVEGIAATHLTGGFFQGWPNPPTPDNHLRILQGSYACILAKNADGLILGFITAISDGVASAYIPLLEVIPSYQGRGIGKQLVQRMLVRLRHLYMVDLCCDPELESFYRNLGMHKTVGMIYRNYDRQACNPR